MATHPHTSSHGPMPPHGSMVHQQNGHMGPVNEASNVTQHLAALNEEAWLRIGSITELMGDADGAYRAFEQVQHYNRYSVPALLAMANIMRSRDQFGPAIEHLLQITKFEERNGEVWASLGHCYLMLDNLQEAYQAYQQALYHLPDLREPRLWYGIGILYDRYGSLEHAEEAFSQVMRMAPDFEKANEIYFRLGIIYKQQQKYPASLDCFRYIVQDPPKPLTQEDIWFQIGHVHEQHKDYESAKAAYMRVLEQDPKHAKVLQQLGWLYHQQGNDYASQEQAIEYLGKSVASDQSDAQSWYLLGRCYMQQQKYPRAYEAYQQAVYRDGRNPTFWCSIGVLYYQINQYRDALDAYSRAIRLNPHISEVWYDLGTLYESCNNQTADALDAYQRAAELDPTNVHIKARLSLLREGGAQNGHHHPSAGPLPPQDIHPQAYQLQMSGPPGPTWNTNGSAPTVNPAGPPTLDYSRRLAEIQSNPPQGPQPLASYDQREQPRPQGLSAPRPASPRQDSLRRYQEPHRPGPGPGQGPGSGPVHRRLSPSPKTRHAAPQYGRPPNHAPPSHVHEALGHHGHQPQPQPPPPPPTRIANPNYAPHPSGPTPSASGVPIPPPPNQHSIREYGRITPPHEARPIFDHRPSSVGTAMHSHHYPPRPTSALPPPPIPTHTPVPLQHGGQDGKEREDTIRTPLLSKRHRGWEDDANLAKVGQGEEKRARLDEQLPRLISLHDRSSPRQRHEDIRRAEEEMRRAGEHRRANDGYHSSEAAHHPISVGLAPAPPAPQPTPPQIPTSTHSFAPPPSLIESRQKSVPPHEPAARKMEVDENYDDDGEDEKRGPSSGTPSKRESPRSERNYGIEGGNEVTKQES